MRYIHQHPEWPNFTWDASAVTRALAEARFRQGEFLGKVSATDSESRSKSFVESLTDEIVASSAIEGESVSREIVRSSVASKIGVPSENDPSIRNRFSKTEGFVSVLWEATTRFDAPLTAERLFAWHRLLFGNSSEEEMEVGRWRSGKSGTMRVVSERRDGGDFIHFEAPESSGLAKEMKTFLAWFESDSSDPLLKAAVAHLWFLTIHPFTDGNGRLARVISELCLARSEKSAMRFYSLSSQIEKERKEYYLNLEFTQKGDLDITDWILWFLKCFGQAIEVASVKVDQESQKRRILEELYRHSPNPREILVVKKLLGDFHGKMTSSKYAKTAKCSQDTAIRDLNHLVKLRILQASEAGGRSRSYSLRSYRNPFR